MRPASSTPKDTRQRLLTAAARVFARDGLAGATTRAIAREAGVNEVTLFRHFQTKDRLLAAVVGQNFGLPGNAPPAVSPAFAGDLRHDLRALAERYIRLLVENQSLVRTMIGEIHHRHREQEHQVFRAIFGPIKEALRERIAQAIAQREIGGDIPADVLADLFGGMLFTGVLRRASPPHAGLQLNYTAEAYLDAAIDLVVRGAAPPRRRRL